MKLLVVEDVEGDAFLIRDMLSGVLPADIVWAQSIKEALANLRSPKFDVITLDLVLPDSQGVEAIPSLLKEGHETPIVIVSGSYQPQVILAAIRAGARDYLVKGKFDAPRLMAVLEAVAAWGGHLKELQTDIRSSGSTT